MSGFFEEIWEEITDFLEDLGEQLFRQPKKITKTRTALIGGVEVKVRPAYIFAERIDNLLKIVFGISISLSAFTATFLGFSSLSQLVEVLVTSLWGRAIMLIIGVSYLMIAVWKLSHLGSKST